MDEAEMNQSILLKNILGFNNKSRSKTIEGKDKQEMVMKVYMLLMNVKN